MKKVITTLTIILIGYYIAEAQIDPKLLKRSTLDTAKQSLNMDAVYERPFITVGKLPVSLGGYMEANWQHSGTDGVSEGHQFQFRRMTLFVASTISKRIKFLSEIEFEPAEKEIAIEFAALDLELHPLLNLRGGMIMNPIGAFNQNHDGPKWEFTDRPIAMTQMLPATWSNAGFGIYGKHYNTNWMFGYEIYASSGFDNSIIANKENKTFLPAAKENTERFEEMASGQPLLTGKIAVRHNKIGEIGLSYMGGIYNKWLDDGIVIDDKRRLNIFAIDFNTTLPNLNTFITAEWAWINIDVPTTYSQQFGNKQQGGYADIVQPILKREILGWQNATINLACRFEYVDWNVGKFKETDENIGDELWSIMPGISFRPRPQTVLRANYRIQSQKDLLGNPPTKTAAIQFGVSTYF
ncbi:hypothetical protein QG516_21465 [Pedobacter gandavensis]|uniref:Phosphate-selective porin O/P n=3 Tax=Pedobacter TaxID=84567 RepID=A0A318UDZ6_9SPHI|nr:MULTISPECIES: hypothetical protein [Pedobacter]AMP99765.1 hypothetical protein AY601_2889 [Pedobacter cryoconitis]PYF74616.1 hypothetical protein B0O44_10361 [Pedobacter nutrimenti]RQO79028.1 hypothetical protein DBR40_04710 [Pedobacter sp. KBW01]WGQ09084.1 hypothetical protein QG516_21465 [Pedobacter gandavensis]SHG05628.1 hypothetical protein SAMN04488522_104310 [Pedobacter caeni]